jgi:hypothetical protein
MDDHEAVAYAQDEYRRLASMRAEPGAPAPESPPGPGATDPPGMTVLPGTATCRSTAGGQAPRSFRPASGRRPPGPPPGRPMPPWQRLVPPTRPGAPKYSLRCQRCQLRAIATRSRGLQNWPICVRPLARMALASATRNRRSVVCALKEFRYMITLSYEVMKSSVNEVPGQYQAWPGLARRRRPTRSAGCSLSAVQAQRGSCQRHRLAQATSG